MSEEEKPITKKPTTITVVFQETEEDITAKEILYINEQDITTLIPTNGDVVIKKKNGVYNKLPHNIPKTFTVSTNPITPVIHKVANDVKQMDNNLNGPNQHEKKEEAVGALTQQETTNSLTDSRTAESLTVAPTSQPTNQPTSSSQLQTTYTSNPASMSQSPQTLLPGQDQLGGYRLTKRRRNPRRKQKKSYRRRRV